MKKSLAIRIDAAVPEAARGCARLDDSTLTDFIGSPLRQRIEPTPEMTAPALPAPIVPGEPARGA